jgi:peptidoglycan DL-endopeptidase CwlO
VARRPHLTRTRTCLAGLSLAATCVGVGMAPDPAVADIGGQIAAAKQRLAALDAQAEAATEHYNAARIALAADQRTAAAAQQRLAQAERVLGRLRATVAGFAVAAYQGQAMETTFGVTADSPQAFLDKLSTLEAVSNSQSQALADLAAAQHEQEQAAASARAALDVQQHATAQMQADRAKVVAAAHEEQHILARLQVRQQAIIRAAKARAARLAAEREAAALAAR